METRPLSSLTPGSRGVVAAILIPPAHRGRLLEMGLLVGTSIEVIRFAPLGDPVEIRIRGYNLSLRRHEAEQVMVRDA
jgi:ferrous iron transport protein A